MLISLSATAVIYTVTHLMRVAAPALSYTISVESEGSQKWAVIHTEHLKLRLAIMDTAQCEALLSGTYHISWVPSFDGAITVPLFLQSGVSFLERHGDIVTVQADIVTLSFLLLSRREELLIPQRDCYGRFLYQWSLSSKYGLIEFPVVDEWGMLLRQELRKIYSEERLGTHMPSLTPTHDMDTARRFPNFYGAVRTILGGDLLRYRNAPIARESLKQYLASRRKPELDPELLGAEALLNRSLQYGLRSEFYFMGPDRGAEDYEYDVNSPAVRAFAQKAIVSGMVCGFHGSRKTPTDLQRFQVEQRREGEALGGVPICGRQHYLCFDAARTPAIWERCGMRYDSTLGYADREGFRCGTCMAYPLYDLQQDRPLNVWERPLIVMDGTLQAYRGLTLDQALQSMKQLFGRSMAVGGDFVLLWHNGSVYRFWKEWYQNVYLPFLAWATQQLRKDESYDQ